MKRVLLCVNSDIGRGNTIGFRFGKIAHELERQGIEVDIFARANYDSTLRVVTPWYSNILGRALNFLHIYLTPCINYRHIDVWFFDWAARSYVKKQKKAYDIVHFGEFASKTMQRVKQTGGMVLLDIPIAHDSYIYTLREKGIDVNKEKIDSYAYIDKAIAVADRLICPSSFVVETVRAAGAQTPVSIIPFGADSVEKDKDVHAGKSSLFTFLFAGSVGLRKGSKYLFEAWSLFPYKENAQLVVCGRVYKEMKSIIQQSELHQVTLVGFTDTIHEYYQSADVFLLPSLMEGSAKATYEAMAYGLPSIVTPNVGSIIEDRHTGLIIPIANSQALCDAMVFLYEHQEQAQIMGEKARQVVKTYTWETYARSVVAVYTTVV